MFAAKAVFRREGGQKPALFAGQRNRALADDDARPRDLQENVFPARERLRRGGPAISHDTHVLRDRRRAHGKLPAFPPLGLRRGVALRFGVLIWRLNNGRRWGALNRRLGVGWV